MAKTGRTMPYPSPTDLDGYTLSDQRLKSNIVRIGTHPLGIGLYEFSYLGQKSRHIGVMAQEVLTVAPYAVATGTDGFYRVDYRALGSESSFLGN